VKELPKLKDLHIADNEIGMPSDLADDGEIPVDYAPGDEPPMQQENQEITDEASLVNNETMASLEVTEENGTLEQDLPTGESPENNA
jgi:hypothetical protein